MGFRTAGRIGTLAIALAVVAPHRARAAEPNESGTAAAESLFQEGRKLASQKRYSEACPKFLASHRLAPAHGTLLNLADCYEKNGQIASAWARFREAIALAQRLGRADREKIAQERAERLEPRLIKLTITSQEADVAITLDGNPLDAAALGTPVPVDPGTHVIEASAKGRKPLSTTVDVSEKDKSPTFTVPALEEDAEAVAVAPKTVTPTEPPADAGTDGSTQRTIGIALGAVGVVGVGVGAFFGLRTQSRWDEAKTHCNASFECDATGVELTGDARTSGNLSTISFIAGGALLAAGAVLFFTAPKPGGGVRLGAGPGSLLLRGTF